MESRKYVHEFATDRQELDSADGRPVAARLVLSGASAAHAECKGFQRCCSYLTTPYIFDFSREGLAEYLPARCAKGAYRAYSVNAAL